MVPCKVFILVDNEIQHHENININSSVISHILLASFMVFNATFNNISVISWHIHVLGWTQTTNEQTGELYLLM